MAKQPSLAGELGALWREGAKDLWNAIVISDPNSMRPGDEPGTPLAPTPQMVTEDLGMGRSGFEAEMQSSAMQATARAADRGRDRGMVMG
ncbi:MAG TPA: hypothetical protein VD866_23625 [Urbifossiella sp.]|nr:hypothetical protein [Urbifossiella sp.]